MSAPPPLQGRRSNHREKILHVLVPSFHPILKCGAIRTSLFAVSFEAPCDGNFLLGLKLIALRKQEKIALFCWELWLNISLQRSPRGFSCLHDLVKQCFLHLYDVAQNSLFQNWHSQSCKMQSQSAPFKHISRSPLAASHRPHLPSHSHHSSLIAWLLWSMRNPLSHSSTYYWGHPTPGCYLITCWVS